MEDMEEVSRVVLLIHLWAEPMIRNEQNTLKSHNAHYGVSSIDAAATADPPLPPPENM